MCGIAGWMRRGDSKLTKDELISFLANLEVRGRDATGVAWRTNGRTYVLKSPAKATEFVELPEFQREIPSILDSSWVLLHTRQSTHGNPKDNRNNHPIYNKDGLIIHNGVVTPKEWLTGAQGQTDTEQILLYIQKYGWQGLADIRGSATFAYVDFKKPGFYLHARGMPLMWAYDRKRKMFLFCSTKHILLQTLKSGRFFGLIPKLPTSSVPQNTIFHINSGIEKIMTVEEPKIAYHHPYGIYYNDFLNRLEDLDGATEDTETTDELS